MKEKTLKASLTVEAAWIMAMVLLSVSVMLQQAARIHDETKAAMGLHEACLLYTSSGSRKDAARGQRLSEILVFDCLYQAFDSE